MSKNLIFLYIQPKSFAIITSYRSNLKNKRTSSGPANKSRFKNPSSDASAEHRRWPRGLRRRQSLFRGVAYAPSGDGRLCAPQAADTLIKPVTDRFRIATLEFGARKYPCESSISNAINTFL